MLLARAALLFTNAWLDAALRSAEGRDRPELLNSEGDPLEFTVLHFPLLPGVTAERVREALASVPALRPEGPAFWNWLAEPGVKPKAVPRRAKGQILTTTMEDGSLVLGTLELKGRRLSLEANSVARAERGRALLEPVLAAERPPPEPSGLSPEDERALVRQGLDGHYRRGLGEPIPALGGKSPRAAAKTAKGRERVAAWLKTLENHSASARPGTRSASMTSAGCGGNSGSRLCDGEAAPVGSQRNSSRTGHRWRWARRCGRRAGAGAAPNERGGPRSPPPVLGPR